MYLDGGGTANLIWDIAEGCYQLERWSSEAGAMGKLGLQVQGRETQSQSLQCV